MADITMCKGYTCKVKETCYRYKAEANKYGQSYFMESPFVEGDCNYYIDYNK